MSSLTNKSVAMKCTTANLKALELISTQQLQKMLEKQKRDRNTILLITIFLVVVFGVWFSDIFYFNIIAVAGMIPLVQEAGINVKRIRKEIKSRQ